jgi:hypothetical protein
MIMLAPLATLFLLPALSAGTECHTDVGHVYEFPNSQGTGLTDDQQAAAWGTWFNTPPAVSLDTNSVPIADAMKSCENYCVETYGDDCVGFSAALLHLPTFLASQWYCRPYEKTNLGSPFKPAPPDLITMIPPETGGYGDCRSHAHPHPSQEPTAAPTAAPTAKPPAPPPPPPPPPAGTDYETRFWIALGFSIAGAVGLIVMLLMVFASAWIKDAWGGLWKSSDGSLADPFV